MTAIRSIEVHIVTGDRQWAGTDERVFLTIGGQDFELDSMANDFERGSDRTYVLGEGATVSHARQNDPRDRITLEDVQAAPIFLRVGETPKPVREVPTERGRDPLRDAMNQGAQLAGQAGAAIREGLMQGAITAHSYWSGGSWNLEEVTVTVHPRSGSPLTFSALKGADNTWLAGRGQPKELELTATA